MIQQYLYRNYVANLAKRFDAALQEIQAEHNFDLGPEFEIAVCKVLSRTLPQQFGICRGFVVDESGQRAGDDIIVFDQMRFPTLRALARDDYSQKEDVPIDAVYAYIEAKHTLDLDGSSASSLRRACKQASKVEALCKRRIPLSLNNLNAYIPLPFGYVAPEGMPKYRNPIHTSVISRRVRHHRALLNDDEEVDLDLFPPVMFDDQMPDLIVAGPSNLVVPGTEGAAGLTLSPFHVEGVSGGRCAWVPGIAFGIGLCSLLLAIDWIQLGKMPWEKIIFDGIRGSQPKPE